MTMGTLTREFPFEKHSLTCYSDIKEVTPIPEGYELKYTQCLWWCQRSPSGNGSAQKSFTIKWKWFIYDHGPWGMQGGDAHKRGVSVILGLTLELCEELLDYVPIKSSQQRTSSFIDGNFKMNGQHLLRSLLLQWRKVKTTQLRGLSCMLFSEQW